MALDTRIPMMATGVDIAGVLRAADQGRAADTRNRLAEVYAADQEKARGLAPAAAGGDNAALEQLLVLDPERAQAIASYRSGLKEAERKETDRRMGAAANLLAPILSAPPEQRPGLYAESRKRWIALGYDANQVPEQFDENFVRATYNVATTWKDQLDIRKTEGDIRNNETKTRNDTRSTDAKVAESAATAELRRAEAENERSGKGKGGKSSAERDKIAAYEELVTRADAGDPTAARVLDLVAQAKSSPEARARTIAGMAADMDEFDAEGNLVPYRERLKQAEETFDAISARVPKREPGQPANPQPAADDPTANMPVGTRLRQNGVTYEKQPDGSFKPVTTAPAS